jgi:ABC-type Fe3+/spermidine/putrescine transport system ATPase subunit
MTAIRIEGLVKRHGGFTAVDNIDLDVAAGELVVLLGPSGCGKTTTLRCIAGLDDATAGEIWIGDDLVSSNRMQVPPEQRAIGMVFQSYALWPHMTVADNLGFGLKLQRVDRADIRRRVDEALELVGMAGYGGRNAGELSGGQQQRVALARAVVLRPKILLFDEPLSNLDAKMRERMRVEIRVLQQRLGITALYVTHDQQEAMVIADRIVLMRAGRIEQIGAPREIYHHPATRFAAEFIGSANILAGRMMADGRIDIEGMKLGAMPGHSRPGDAVNAVVRPEHIAMERGGADGPNRLAGRVTSAIFLGNLGEIEVRVGEQTLRVQTSPPGDWAAGEAVTLHIERSQVVLLDGTTSQGGA